LNLIDHKKVLDISHRLLSVPTAPFHEEQVLRYIKEVLHSNRIPFKEDSGGNLIARLKKGRGVLPIAFVAHTDHPGIHIIGKGKKEVIGQFLGGVDLKMMRGAKVDLFSKKGHEIKGKISGGRIIRGIKTVRVEVTDLSNLSPGDFGMFCFPGWRVRNGKVYSRAIDDLMGCAAILNLLIRLSRSGKSLDLYGLFTRGEEVGFIGTHHLIAQETIPLHTLMISVETSKAYPFAKMGGGPVLRIGDKASLFNPEIDFYFQEVAEQLIRKDKTFKFQRLLMPGGTCEATPFSLAGYRAFGIAFPLGNYHNMSPRGKIRAEYIDLNDFFNGILFMEMLTRNLHQFEKRKSDLSSRIKRHYLNWKKRLLDSAKKG
jgi:putative aminopeptidase FrvX